MPPIPEPPQHLSDGVVALRLSAERDIPEVLIAYQDDRHMHERLGEDRPPSGAQLGRRSEEAPARRIAGHGVTLTVLRDGSDECVGEIRVHHVEWAHSRAELDMWLAPGVRGLGLAPRALALIARWLFDASRLDRLAVLTEPDNAAMVGAARAAGFLEEGLLRGYARVRGRRVDCAILSLLPTDLSP